MLLVAISIGIFMLVIDCGCVPAHVYDTTWKYSSGQTSAYPDEQYDSQSVAQHQRQIHLLQQLPHFTTTAVTNPEIEAVIENDCCI